MKKIHLANTEPWYTGYAFQGAVVLGTAPILIPLIVGKAGGAAQAGIVVAAFYLGQLLAPLFGAVTDRLNTHKRVYLGGYVLLGVGLCFFPVSHNLIFWVLLALIQGAGVAASNTVATMFIVEFKPKSEWDVRIGWLQTFYGAGQAIGLALAAALQAWPGLGMVISGLLMIPGLFLGRVGLPDVEKRTVQPDYTVKHGKLKPPRLGITHSHHLRHLTLENVVTHLSAWRTPFVVYIASWFLSMLGMWLVFNLYPLLMQSAYGIDAGLSSLYYALAATVGVFAYSPSGLLGQKIGDAWVVFLGMFMLLLSFAGMAILAVFGSNELSTAWLAPLSFALAPIAWSPLIVAGTGLTAQLASAQNMDEGPAMGIFSASGAVASVLGALAAGGIAQSFGYAAVTVVAAVLVLLGMVCVLPLLRRPTQPVAPEDKGAL